MTEKKNEMVTIHFGDGLDVGIKAIKGVIADIDFDDKKKDDKVIYFLNLKLAISDFIIGRDQDAESVIAINSISGTKLLRKLDA